MRFSTAPYRAFLLFSALAAGRAQAQSFQKDSPGSDSAYALAVRQYHSYVAPEVGLYRGTQYVDYDYTVQKGQPFFGPDLVRYGSVWYGGIGYDHVRMLYDLVKDQLVILDPQNIYKISLYMDLVDSFALDGQPFFRIRDSLASPALRSGYWERIYRGRTVLVKQERKFLRENTAVTPDNVRLFIEGSTSYYLNKGGIYYPVNRRRELFAILKDRRRSDIRRVMRKSNFRWKTDKEQLLQLVAAWYDGDNH